MEMHCPNCTAENQPSAKFCAECGTAFPTSCVKCGFKNPPAAKFCQECEGIQRKSDQRKENLSRASRTHDKAVFDAKKAREIATDCLNYLKALPDHGSPAQQAKLKELQTNAADAKSEANENADDKETCEEELANAESELEHLVEKRVALIAERDRISKEIDDLLKS